MNIREIRDSDEMLWVIGVIDIPNLCHVFEIRVKIPSRIAMFLSLLNFFFFFFYPKHRILFSPREEA